MIKESAVKNDRTFLNAKKEVMIDFLFVYSEWILGFRFIG